MSNSARYLPQLLALGLIAALAGCADSSAPEIPETPPDVLYNKGLNALEQGNVADAATLFQEVERQHPYSAIEPQSEVMVAYAYYRGDKYTDAITSLDHFIQLHPGNKYAPYAYYLKALCYYEQIEDVRRDQKMTEQALAALNEVVNRFPTTAYARDARLKIDLTRDHLAGKEMDIGRYYEGQKLYLAAINRFRTVVEKYQTTSHTPEALERLTECYLALGVNEEAQTAAAVLGYNYPGSTWYQASYDLLKDKNLKPEKSSNSWLSDF